MFVHKIKKNITANRKGIIYIYRGTMGNAIWENGNNAWEKLMSPYAVVLISSDSDEPQWITLYI